MTYIFHVLISQTSGAWRARCPALESHGAISGGETKEEALAHIHNTLLMILLDMEAKGKTIPGDDKILNGIPVSVDTTAK